METRTERTTQEQPAKRSYHEPLLIRHEPLHNITGVKYGEKDRGNECIKLGDECE
jgi:hypothetical protein